MQASNQAPNNTVEHSALIPQDRESFALSAGFALGLVNLGRGHASSGAACSCIVEKLKRLIMGGLSCLLPLPHFCVVHVHTTSRPSVIVFDQYVG